MKYCANSTASWYLSVFQWAFRWSYCWPDVQPPTAPRLPRCLIAFWIRCVWSLGGEGTFHKHGRIGIAGLRGGGGANDSCNTVFTNTCLHQGCLQHTLQQSLFKLVLQGGI